MLRSLPPAVLACLTATAAVALAEPGPQRSASTHDGNPGAHATSAKAAPKLTIKSANTQMKQFLTAATQVTGLPESYFVGTCDRRSKRALDCGYAIPGHARGAMRAKLLGGSRPRVQLYVLHATPVH
jgi:hypothetical protein